MLMLKISVWLELNSGMGTNIIKNGIDVTLSERPTDFANGRGFYLTRYVEVKCRLLISSIFDGMNFQHFSEMLEFDL